MGKRIVNGWVLVKYKPTRFLFVDHGLFDWTADKEKALHMSRRSDADALAEIVDDAEHVIQKPVFQ